VGGNSDLAWRSAFSTAIGDMAFQWDFSRRRRGKISGLQQGLQIRIGHDLGFVAGLG